MPMPYAYRHASAEFRAFLDAAKDLMGLDSDNATYTAIEGVLRVFRRRLTVDQALRVADLLPAVLRAIFVADWRPVAPVPWGTRAGQVAEARALRPHHNLTPETCIDAVAEALSAQVPPGDLARVLTDIGPEALAFWHVPQDRLRPLSFP